MSKEILTAEILEARKQLWKMGILDWKFEDCQKRVYDLHLNNPKKTTVVTISRRAGKTYTLLAIATMQCIKHPKSIVKMLLPEQKMARTIVRPIIDEIFKDAPANLRPKFKTQDSIYKFANGSEIQLAGTDNGNHEKLRGTDAHLCIIDEAGFVQADLDYIVSSILLPSTLITNGKIIISSTPPRESNHPYTKYVETAKLNNGFIMLNIDDLVADESCSRITPEIVSEIEAQYSGGRTNADFRREMLCEFTSDGSQRVVPEFTKEVEEDVVTEWPRPGRYHCYASMDIGFVDLTACLFAYYDYYNGVLVIEDELVINGPEMTTERLANDIFLAEDQIWTHPLTNEKTEPYERTADNNLIVINDLDKLYGLRFYPANKANRDAAIAELRSRIEQRQIIINPRCKHTIAHLRNATWDKSRRDFTRSAEGGHYDTIPALYMLLRIEGIWQRNPYPTGQHRSNHIDTFNFEKDSTPSDLKGLFKKQFGRKSTTKPRK